MARHNSKKCNDFCSLSDSEFSYTDKLETICLGHNPWGFLEYLPKTVMLERLVDVSINQMVD